MCTTSTKTAPIDTDKLAEIRTPFLLIDGTVHTVVPVEHERTIADALNQKLEPHWGDIFLVYQIPTTGIGMLRESLNHLLFDMLERTRAQRELLPDTIRQMQAHCRWCRDCIGRDVMKLPRA